MIQISHLHKSYPTAAGAVPVLRGLNWRVEQGGAVAVIGPSGSGKTTLLNLLGALDRPDEGSIRIGDEELSQLSAEDAGRFRNQSVGFVFQQHYLLPQLNVLENVLVPRLAGNWQEPAEDSRKRAVGLLERVGLAGRLNHLPWQLSGGEKLRTAVVRALLNRPQLVLADEPTGMLDPAATDAVADLLLQLQREAGTTLIVVTHHLGLARRIGRTCELRDGVLREVTG